MSEYMRKSMTVPSGEKFRAYDEFKMVRVTVTVLLVTSQHKRTWKRAVERLGLKITEVDRKGVHPVHGEPRTMSFSVIGVGEFIDELRSLYIVEGMEFSEAAVPRGGRPQDYQLISGRGQERVSTYIPVPHGKPKPPKPPKIKFLDEAAYPNHKPAKPSMVSASQEDSHKVARMSSKLVLCVDTRDFTNSNTWHNNGLGI